MKDRTEYHKRYYQEHKEQFRIKQRRHYRTEKGQAYLAKVRISEVRKRIFEKLGSACKRCGFDDIRALQIDHVKGGGKKEIASFTKNLRTYYKHVLADTEDKYQILCANCNWIKRYENRECQNDR